MNQGGEISIAIAALNEEKDLEATVTNIIEAAKIARLTLFEIIIVNDGSTDQTGLIAKRLEKTYSFIHSIHNEKNMGVGNSVKKAVKISKYEKFVLLPGDNHMRLSSIINLFLHKDKADVVPVYYINGEVRGRWRENISILFGMIYMSVFGIFLHYINGPAIFPTDKIRKLDIKSKRFSIAAELTVKMLRMGCSFYEIPVYRQKGLSGSTSLSFISFIEVVTTFLRLIYEIKFAKRNLFNRKPIRVYE